ncbi:MAG: ABC transporter permease [Acidobacteriota bacterium]
MAPLKIVLRDLRRMVRNPIRTGLLFALPLMMAGIFALVFGGGSVSEISIRVLVYDEDQGLVSSLLGGAGSSPDMDRRLDLVPVGDEGFEMMERGEASALVHIPAGFAQAYLDGEPAVVSIVKNPAERFLPQVVEEGGRIGAEILSQGSRVFRTELATIGNLITNTGFPSDLAVGSVASGVNQKLQSLDKWVLPPVIDLVTSTVTPETTEESENGGNGILGFFLPGLSMMGILFLAQSATRDILHDRESGLVRHLLTAPVSPSDYILGKCLSVLLISTLGFFFLVAFGIAAGVNWGPVSTTVALVLTASLAAAGALVLISSLVGTERQADTLSTIVITVWCLIGGAFVPISQFPDFLRPLAKMTPVFWAVDGFQKAMQHGADIAAVSTNLLVLGGTGVIFLGLGAAALRRRMAGGLI